MTPTSGTASAAGDDFPDWSGLPDDLLLTVMSALQVPDLVYSGAVCRSWRSAFATFRRLRLPSPPHPPCLLYAAAADNAVRIYSPSTDEHFRVPVLEEEAAGGVVGSAHGWLFTTDRAANPYLLNPLTGARAALPLITTLERVKGRRFVLKPGDGGGRGVAYDVDFGWPGHPDVKPVMARKARQWMYRRVALSASPSSAADGGSGCVVLLLHMPHHELSFAMPGDERWTTLAGIWESPCGNFLDAVHNPDDGLFYVLEDVGSWGETEVHSLDLADPSSPVATTLMYTTPARPWNAWIKMTMGKYLAVTPRGDLLLAERRWCKWATNLTREHIPSDPRVASDEESIYDVRTTEIHLLRLDIRRYEQEKLPGGVGDDLALFLGHAATACLRVEDYPMFRGNCAYLTDDSDQTHPPYKRLDLGVWEFGSNSGGRLTKLRDTWPLHDPWQDNSPTPIWFTPSLD